MSRFYRVPYCVPAWGWAEHRAILRCLLTGKMIEGPDKEKLYQAIRERTGVPHVFGFGSGREAIFAALKAWGVGQGDRVILPSYCCESVVSPVVDCGAEPAFCDIGGDFNLDVDDALSLVNERTKAIIVPHLFGRPARIDQMEERLTALGCRERVLVIDDAAQSFGATLDGRMVGTYGDVGIVSFGPGKTMTATGGGLLLTSSPLMAERIGLVATRPIEAAIKLNALFYWLVFRRWRRYTLPALGVYRRLTGERNIHKSRTRCLANVDAALGREQLEKLASYSLIRRRRWSALHSVFSLHIASGKLLNYSAIPGGDVGELPVRFIVLSSATAAKKDFTIFLESLKVEIHDLYRPLHTLERFARCTRRLPKTEQMAPLVMQVPIDPSISEHTFETIKAALADWLGQSHLGKSARGAPLKAANVGIV